MRARLSRVLLWHRLLWASSSLHAPCVQSHSALLQQRGTHSMGHMQAGLFLALQKQAHLGALCEFPRSSSSWRSA